MSTDSSAFLLESRFVFDTRYVSEAALRTKPGKELRGPEYDLITFLAVVQKMEIDILPITWQSARDMIGRGGTSDINEALINLQTSFAFKCLSNDQKQSVSKNQISRSIIFQTLVNEIIILGHPGLREHPNMVALQGICWDIPADDEIWPVLVFEKSQFGDLHSFLTLPVGRDLQPVDRMNLCADVGAAVLSMHSNRIIHGDIKPENVLVFKVGTNKYSARVTDFGYSTRLASEDEDIPMPKSWPWYAPEYRLYCNQAQGRKMDIFSFGMLCLWVMFEKYLSATAPLPQEALWAEQYLPNKTEKNQSKRFLEELKKTDKLVLFAQQLVTAERDLVDSQKQALRKMFGASLPCNPDERAADLKQLVICLTSSEPLSESINSGGDLSNVMDCHFEILQSIGPLYRSDYRVRPYVYRCLKQRVPVVAEALRPIDPDIAFQLAVCYNLGFGVTQDHTQSLEYLLKSGRTDAELDNAIDLAHKWDQELEEHRGTIYSALLELGHVHFTDFTTEYRTRGTLEEAEAKINHEIHDASLRAVKDSRIVTLLTVSLSRILADQGKWEQARELDMRVIETCKSVLGPEHSGTLTSMNNLALALWSRGEWDQAEELGVQVMQGFMKTLGPEHAHTLISMMNLTLIYRSQGRLTRAKELAMRVTDVHKKVLGPEHLDTLNSMSNLASTLGEQGEWKQAEEIFRQVMETCKRVLGPEHPSTLNSMSNLASTLWNQGQLGQAEELAAQSVDSYQRVLGLQHQETLSSMNNLASIYKDQGRFDQALELFTQVQGMIEEAFGPEHPTTLQCMNNLILTMSDQGQWDQAEQMAMQLVEKSKKVLGPEHLDTLHSMNTLALVLSGTGQSERAKALEIQVMETSGRVFGTEHRFTLTCISNLASTYRDEDRLDEAEELDFKVMETRKKVLGPEHLDTLLSMNNLAMTYLKKGRRSQAEDLLVEVINIARRVLTVDHPYTLGNLINLASVYKSYGQLDQAEKLLEEVVEVRKRLLGAEHPDTLAGMAHLAETYMQHGRLERSEELFRPIMEATKSVLGPEHPHTLASMNNLATALANQGIKDQTKWVEAGELLSQVVETSKRVIGEGHPNTLSGMRNLAVVYRNQGRLEEAKELEGRVSDAVKSISDDPEDNEG